MSAAIEPPFNCPRCGGTGWLNRDYWSGDGDPCPCTTAPANEPPFDSVWPDDSCPPHLWYEDEDGGWLCAKCGRRSCG